MERNKQKGGGILSVGEMIALGLSLVGWVFILANLDKLPAQFLMSQLFAV